MRNIIHNNSNTLDNDLFSMQLYYNTADNSQFNGNVGGNRWKSDYYQELKKIDFIYDGLNRLETAELKSIVFNN